MSRTSLKKSAGRPRAGWGVNVWTFFRYSAASLFSGRAAYFMILATAIFLAVVVFNLVSRETAFSSPDIYDLLLIPGILLVFYPAVFGIQNDKDAGMIETLFGIPDYRYKVWLARYVILYMLVAALLLVLAILCRIGLADFPLGRMVLQVMVPVIFLGSLAFFVASQTGSGLGTAVIMVVVVLFFWLFRASLEGSSWYLFYNPFSIAGQVGATVLAKMTIANRLYAISGSLLLTMLALLRLQKREKFI